MFNHLPANDAYRIISNNPYTLLIHTHPFTVQTSGHFSFGTADDGDSGARGGGGPFRLSKKKRAVKSRFGGVVLTIGDLCSF